MAQPTFIIAAICLLFLSHLFISGVEATTFTIENKCDYVVWPGILSNAGIPPLPTTGFTLQRGESKTITAPKSWGGRFWGRTHCSQDSAGRFSCLTGECGSGKLECAGNGAAPPATLAEFTLNGANGLDYFDVSLVDGYNIPMLVVPQGGKGQNCSTTGCVVDLNGLCPSELRVMSADGRDGVACKSACEAFRQPQYCCSGAYATPDTCKPSPYSKVFKKACPRAYSYAYDDKTSTFTCANAADYKITFCHDPNTSQKSSGGAATQGQNTETTATTTPTAGQNTETTTTTTMPSQGTPTSPDLNNSTIVYEGFWDGSGASPSTVTLVFGSNPIAAIVSITLTIWWWLQLI